MVSGVRLPSGLWRSMDMWFSSRTTEKPRMTGVCLFARSQERIRAFEMQVLSEYARLLHGSRTANPDLSSADVALSAWSLDGVPA